MCNASSIQGTVIIEGESHKLSSVLTANKKRAVSVGRKRLSRRRGQRDPNEKLPPQVPTFGKEQEDKDQVDQTEEQSEL